MEKKQNLTASASSLISFTRQMQKKNTKQLLDEWEEVTIMLGPIYFYYGCHTKQQKLLKLY